MEAGVEFPPLIVYYDGEVYWLAAGFHRLEATRSLQHTEAWCVVRQGTVREAILCALGQNERHGLRRTPGDRRRAVVRMLEDAEWQMRSDAWIARTCDVDPTYVAGIRSELVPIVHDASQGSPGMRLAQRGGQVYPIRPANQHTQQTAAVSRPAGIREADVKPRYLQIRTTLESIDRAMSALPAPDLAVVADPDFALEAAQAHSRWWQAFAAHLQRRADRAS